MHKCILRVLYQYYDAQMRPLNPSVATNEPNINKILMLN